MIGYLIASVWVNVQDLNRRARGQGLVEYVIILSLIAVAAAVVLVFVGGTISAILSTVGHGIQNGNVHTAAPTVAPTIAPTDPPHCDWQWYHGEWVCR